MSEKSKPIEYITLGVTLITLSLAVITALVNYNLDSKLKTMDTALKEADKNVKVVELNLKSVESTLRTAETKRTYLAAAEYRERFWKSALDVYDNKFNVEKRIMGNNHRVLEAFF